MKHKVATFEYPNRSGIYSRGPHLPSWRQARTGSGTKNHHTHTRNLESPVHKPRPYRSQRRHANYRGLLVLVPTLFLGLLLSRLLFSLLPTSDKTFAPQQSEQKSQKVAVLQSPAQVLPPTPSMVALGRAIVEKESLANSQSQNPHSGALGLAQIMPANLSQWSQDILGYRLTPDEFLNSPYLQLKIIDYKLSEYWQEALAESEQNEELAVLKVASYWYSGNPNLYNSTEPQWYRGTDSKLHRYPSVAQYSNSILKKYRHYRRGKS